MIYNVNRAVLLMCDRSIVEDQTEQNPIMFQVKILIIKIELTGKGWQERPTPSTVGEAYKITRMLGYLATVNIPTLQLMCYNEL